MLACRQYTEAGNVRSVQAFGVAAATVSTAVMRTRGG
jgi:hypothetical protein